MSDVEVLWAELHRRVVASGRPVTKRLLSRILDEMEREEKERHRREMGAANRQLVGAVCLLAAVVILGGGFALLVTFGR